MSLVLSPRSLTRNWHVSCFIESDETLPGSRTHEDAGRRDTAWTKDALRQPPSKYEPPFWYSQRADRHFLSVLEWLKPTRFCCGGWCWCAARTRLAASAAAAVLHIWTRAGAAMATGAHECTEQALWEHYWLSGFWATRCSPLAVPLTLRATFCAERCLRHKTTRQKLEAAWLCSFAWFSGRSLASCGECTALVIYHAVGLTYSDMHLDDNASTWLIS